MEKSVNGRIQTVGVLFAGALPCADAQWLNYPTPGTPRTRDGKPDLSAKARRAPPAGNRIYPESGSPN
jgi:hypothetical protein